MNISFEENDYSGKDKKPEFKIDKTVDLSEAVMNDSTPGWVNILNPTYISGYDISGGNGRENSFILTLKKKPNWFHRTCCRFFLGWKWNEGNESKKENNKKNLLLG